MYHKLETAIRCRIPEDCGERDPLIILYFDEIRSLTRKGEYTIQSSPGDNPLGSAQEEATSTEGIYPTPYAALRSAIASLERGSCFTLFISTYTPLYTSGSLPTAPSSSGTQVDFGIIQAPFTETPFDCHPSFPVIPSHFTLAGTARVEFLARFGRPLFVFSHSRPFFG